MLSPASFRRARVAFAMLAACAVPLAACASAPQNTTGGQPLFDAAAPAATSDDNDAGSLGTGHTWTELYNDYFGNTSRGTACAGNGSCHGSMSAPGFSGSGGYICPLGDKDACYQSMIDPTVAMVALPKGDTDPTHTQLLETLRKTVGGGSMPRAPYTYAFTPTDVARITAWIQDGAKND